MSKLMGYLRHIKFLPNYTIQEVPEDIFFIQVTNNVLVGYIFEKHSGDFSLKTETMEEATMALDLLILMGMTEFLNGRKQVATLNSQKHITATDSLSLWWKGTVTLKELW